jgi:hypothetical protein
LIRCGLETARIETAVEVGGDLKSGLGLGGAGVVEDLLVVVCVARTTELFRWCVEVVVTSIAALDFKILL